MNPALDARDTDADWRELGASQPYWGVLTAPEFRSENITPERVEEFYASGRTYIDEIAVSLQVVTGAGPAGWALDFGCGVGRLAEAMGAHAGDVTGYDISPGMLTVARERGGNVSYVGEMPDGPFDWINTFIVFQHIEPSRGLEILKELMSRLAPGGAVSLHFTIWREPHLEPPTYSGWSAKTQAQRYRAWLKSVPPGHIHMYDYDLSQIVRVLNRGGVEVMQLTSTDHAGHHGVIILGRKTAQPSA